MSMTPKDTSVLRKYAPAYVPVADYKAQLAGNKAKKALLDAATRTATAPVEVLPSDAETFFPLGDEVARTRKLLGAQKPAALVQPNIDELHRILKEGEKDFDKITEPRWRAAYDLAYGRALAAKARTDGYMFMLAAMRNGKQVEQLQQADVPIKNSAVDKMADQARERLKRVATEHAGTPWAKAAQRELTAPIGWKFADEKTQ